jgi:hypothetical protein
MLAEQKGPTPAPSRCSGSPHRRGQQCAPSIPGLFIVATAGLARLAVLRVDKNSRLISMITGRWIESLDA